MSFNVRKICQCAAIAVTLSMFAGAQPSAAPRPGDPDDRDSQVRRVLLISIDGMHALDYENCAKAGTCSCVHDRCALA